MKTSGKKYPDRETACLFALVRAGLWEVEPDDCSLFPLSTEGWERVYGMARRQTVTGLAYRGMCRLPDHLMPPDGLLVRWVAETEAIEQRNRRMNRVLSGLCDKFRTAGLEPVVLKGQGVALMYEQPLLRECGDIDLYFPDKKQQEQATELMRRAGVEVLRHADGSYSYRWDGVEVEHHTRLLDLCNPKLDAYLDELEEVFSYHSVLLASEEGAFIRIPSPTLNVLLLNTHILKHAIGHGIGLRQLCDMARACQLLHVAVDAEVIHTVCRMAGIAEWCRLLHTFLGEYLGLPVASLPSPERMDTARPLLDKVLHDGNFGLHKEGRSHAVAGGWKRKMETAHAFVENMGFSYRYARNEAFWTFTRLVAGQFRR